MNPLIDLPQVLIGKLGRTTGMFLVCLHNSQLGGLTFVAKFFVWKTWFLGSTSLNIISTFSLFSIVASWINISGELVKPK